VLHGDSFENVGETWAFGGGTLPLEELTLAAPDLLISGTPLPGASRSEAVLAHPALQALRAGRAGLRITSPDWLCGTPHVLDAAARLVTTRQDQREARE